MKSAPFKSTFAILDVMKGRKALLKRVKAGEKIKVRCDMTIEYQYGNDDGESIEFSCSVQSVEV